MEKENENDSPLKTQPLQKALKKKNQPNRVEEVLVPASQPPTEPLQFLLVCPLLVLGVSPVPEEKRKLNNTEQQKHFHAQKCMDTPSQTTQRSQSRGTPNACAKHLGGRERKKRKYLNPNVAQAEQT